MKNIEPGIVTIPDKSNGPKTIKQPKNCHCHCAPIIIGYYKETLLLAPHEHRGKGGWWRNDNCEICK